MKTGAKVRKRRFLALVVVFSLFFQSDALHSQVAAKEIPLRNIRSEVYTEAALRETLNRSGSLRIVIKKTITIRKTIHVHGTKELVGDGGELRRAIARNSAFGGALLQVDDGTLSLKNVRIHGRGNAKVLREKLYGRLVEVIGGRLMIREGTSLTKNINSSRLSDGGGAVRVRSGAVCVMTGGSICANASITGGGGVRIDPGGTFSMKGGQISGNRVTGRGTVENFEGLGGGICNRGSVELAGGTISGNTATGYISGNTVQGGVGGGVCNRGDMILSGTRVRGNSGENGDDIGMMGGTVLLKKTVNADKIWLKKGCSLTLDGSFSVSNVIRIEPEQFTDGVLLARGAEKKDLTRFRLTGDRNYVLRIRRSGLTLVKKNNKPAPTPKPTATPPHITNSPYPRESQTPGFGPATPVPEKRPVYPSYAPIVTADPEALIHTAPPRTRIPIPTIPPIRTFTPTSEESASPAPTVTPVITQEPSASPSASPTPSPASEGTIWCFSREEIMMWKRELKIHEYGRTRAGRLELLRKLKGE